MEETPAIEAAQTRVAALAEALKAQTQAEQPLEVPSTVVEEIKAPVQRYAVNSDGFLAPFYERTSRTGEQFFTYHAMHKNGLRIPRICVRWSTEIRKQLREQELEN